MLPYPPLDADDGPAGNYCCDCGQKIDGPGWTHLCPAKCTPLKIETTGPDACGIYNWTISFGYLGDCECGWSEIDKILNKPSPKLPERLSDLFRGSDEPFKI